MEMAPDISETPQVHSQLDLLEYDFPENKPDPVTTAFAGHADGRDASSGDECQFNVRTIEFLASLNRGISPVWRTATTATKRSLYVFETPGRIFDVGSILHREVGANVRK